MAGVHVACQFGARKCLALLYAHEQLLNTLNKKPIKTKLNVQIMPYSSPLQVAISFSNFDCAQWIIDYQSSLKKVADHKDGTGQTALHTLIRSDSEYARALFKENYRYFLENCFVTPVVAKNNYLDYAIRHNCQWFIDIMKQLCYKQEYAVLVVKIALEAQTDINNPIV